jgi:hypothetical protein
LRHLIVVLSLAALSGFFVGFAGSSASSSPCKQNPDHWKCVQTSTTTPPLSDYPASFFTGPSSDATILATLPPVGGGAYFGSWPGEVGWNEQQKRDDHVATEAYLGRNFKLYGIHYAAPIGGCWYGSADEPFNRFLNGMNTEQFADSRGEIPYITWVPGFTLSQMNQGQADTCWRTFAQRAKAFAKPILLRPFPEFNCGWSDGHMPLWGGVGQAHIDAWRRMVGVFQQEQVTNVAFFWNVCENYYRQDMPFSYPGDAYVDWVGPDLYNSGGAGWCNDHGTIYQGECSFHARAHEHCNTHEPNGGCIELDFRNRKPVIAGEVGTNEAGDGGAVKAQWYRDARDILASGHMPSFEAIAYFNQNAAPVEGCCNWRYNTTTTAAQGFRDWALAPYMNP